jgi:MHS family proline/betaine transporter-like MFS transporter
MERARPLPGGAGLAGSVLLARATMEESPEFERPRSSGTVPRHPLRHALARHRPAIARGFAISALRSITYYVDIIYVPAFLSGSGAMGEAEALRLSTLAAARVIVVTPLVGALTDRVGRMPVLLGSCGCAALLPATMFALMGSGSPGYALAGAPVLAAPGVGVSAVGAVATAERFQGEGRPSGLALGATTAIAIFGGLAPCVAQVLLERTGSAMVSGAMIPWSRWAWSRCCCPCPRPGPSSTVGR